MNPSANGMALGRADLSVQGLLLDIDKFASHDGPGIRTTVFLKGCPLSCLWCHSPESRLNQPEILVQDERCDGCWLCLDECPHHAISRETRGEREIAVLNRSLCDACGRCTEVCYGGALQLAGSRVTVGEVVSRVEKDLPFFRNSGGGVTLSGGEPARQPHFSINFLMACQERGIHTALETTGYARWEVISSLAAVTDLFLYDIKFVDCASHQEFTGVPNQRILENLRKLAALGSEIHVRVPCIAGINDSPEQIEAISHFVAESGLTQIVLLPYNGAASAKYQWLDRTFALGNRESQSEETMHRLADICRRDGLNVQIGG